MENCYGQHGWKEFHRNRKNILDEVDKITEQTVNRPVKTAHGHGAEAFIRKWLSEFLPKKFAVTSGYIIPNLYDDRPKIYHYDIIIYDLIESPILWTEGNEDNNEQGKFRAIPAKHVYAVYEVKSRITKQTVSDSIAKLDQTKIFSNQLNPKYSCGIIFVDLKEQENMSKSILKEFHNGANAFGFKGGMILRYEGDENITGLLSLQKTSQATNKKSETNRPLAKSVDNLGIHLNEEGGLTITEGGAGALLVADSDKNTWYVSKVYTSSSETNDSKVLLSWSKSNFSTFCMELLSSLEGTSIDPKQKPRFGMIFDTIELKKAPIQSPEPQPGLPFLSISINTDSDKNGVIFERNRMTLSFVVEVKNEGESEVILSDDRFNTKINLPGRGKVGKQISLTGDCEHVKTINKFKKRLLSEGLEIPYRIVYYETQGEKVLYAVERIVIFKDSKIDFKSD